MEEMNTVDIDPERQDKAREYARIRRRLMLVSLGWNGAYALVWLFTGWALDLRNWLLHFSSNPWALVAMFAVIFGAIDMILSSPLSYYSGYVLPRRYGLSNQSLKDWIIDGIKGLLVGGPLGLGVLEVVYLLLRAEPQYWWLLASAFMLVFSVLLSNLAPILIAPLFNKYVPLSEEHADLEARLLQLAKKAHTRVRGVYKFDMSRQTSAANAGLTGIGNSRRIVLGDTLIENFTPDEIETVLAHELGHQVHGDIPLGIIFSTLTTLLGFFLASLALNGGVVFFSFQSKGDIATLPLLMLVFGIYGIVTMPLENIFSRWRERRADEYALQSTQKPTAFASAMTRLANQNLSELDPEPWVEFLLYSHPTLKKRIDMAEHFSTQQEESGKDKHADGNPRR
jgi:STE24 endopeptidase